MAQLQVCPRCNDTGWELIVTESGSQVKRCVCFKQKKIQHLYEEAKIPRNLRPCRLNNFNIYRQQQGKQKLDPQLATAREVAEKFVREYPGVERGLFFMGDCGVGKTHLAVAIINELILTKGVAAIFYDFRDLLKELRRSYDTHSQVSEFSVLDPVLNKEILVLDELGARKVTDWMQDILTYIINKRYNENKLMLITSNWIDQPRRNEETLTERIGHRLRSRLDEMCYILNIKGEDYRRRQGKEYIFKKKGKK